LDQKISIAKAARMLEIKNSTAKLIVKRFRETGTFFQPRKHQNQ
jgi:transposase